MLIQGDMSGSKHPALAPSQVLLAGSKGWVLRKNLGGAADLLKITSEVEPNGGSRLCGREGVFQGDRAVSKLIKTQTNKPKNH